MKQIKKLININTNKQLQKRFYYLILLSLCVVSGVFAWFFTTKETDTSGIIFKTEKMIGAKISLNDSEYKINQSDNNAIENMEEISGLGYKDADNNLHLYKPEKNPFTGSPINSQTGESITSENQTWKLERELEKNKDYLEYDIKVQANLAGTLYLNKESSIDPLNINENISSFGDFSKNYIAAATRVSFCEIDENDKEHLRAIWAPNKDYELVVPESEDLSQIEGWSFDTKSTNAQTYQYYDGSQIQTVENNNLNKEYTDRDFTFADEFISEYGIKIGDLVKSKDINDDNVYCHLKVRIWVEGLDREAKTPLTGGQFKVKLVFGSRSNNQE